jgi:hypothetical protein
MDKKTLFLATYEDIKKPIKSYLLPSTNRKRKTVLILLNQ